MPHGYTDSEWAKMKVKNKAELDEKIKRDQEARDRIFSAGEIPVQQVPVKDIPKDAVEEVKLSEIKEPAKKAKKIKKGGKK